jgi:hypothetical protein
VSKDDDFTKATAVKIRQKEVPGSGIYVKL